MSFLILPNCLNPTSGRQGRPLFLASAGLLVLATGRIPPSSDADTSAFASLSGDSLADGPLGKLLAPCNVPELG